MCRRVAKILAMVLSACILLAGCGKSPEEISGQVEGVVTQPREAEQENLLTLGRMEGGTYQNTYAGFGCTLDSTWTFFSAEELQQLPAQVAEGMEDGELAGMLGEYDQITDLMAENKELLASINVLLQKVPLSERAAAMSMGEAEIVDQILAHNGEMMRSAYEQAGITVTEMKRVEVRFLDQGHSALYTAAQTQGVPVYMVQLMDYTRGTYCVTTTFTSYVEDNTQSLMELFFAVS